jgi:lipopolysaccharide transport system permease protein
MLDHLRELFQARELLYVWTRREFRVRYSQSLLGVAWVILQPLALMVIFTIVFSTFLSVPSAGVPYPIFAYTALLPWTFFASALGTAIPSLANNFTLVSRIAFPREILPLANILTSGIDFLFASVILLGMIAVYHIQITTYVLLVPLLVAIQLVLTIGISLAGAAANVFYRDIRYVIPLLLQVWLYLTPVIYPAEVVPVRLQPLYFLNPMATLIDAYRRVILFGQPPQWGFLAIAAGVSAVIAVLAYRSFKRAERKFADKI